MTKFLLAFILIVGGLATGYAGKGILDKTEGFSADRVASMLRTLAVLFLMPVITAGTLWGAQVRTAGLVFFPFLGTTSVILGGILGLGAADILKLEPKQKGSLFLAGAFSNFGSFGGFLCYVFWGEPGYALVLLYKLFDEINLVCIGYPVAKYFGSLNNQNPASAGGFQLKRFFKDPFLLIPTFGILLGFILNLTGLKRPGGYGELNLVLLPLATFFLLITIGFKLNFKSITTYLRECALISLIKFLALPAVMGGILLLSGINRLDAGLPFKVALVLSATPVAFYATIPPAIYGLDTDLANSGWIFSTGLFLLLLPLFYLIFY